ncbi:uncharacterized protein METZ01_LOCUS402623 [marine metagenome]|uniref:Uncharacterized protein n=1 Tax=marine metagenome TaxID=408172 RepID=A0A382VTC0_9ZZZZ
MQKKQAVAHVVGHGLCSVRRACHYLGVHRSTYRYRAKPLAPKQIQLHQPMVALSCNILAMATGAFERC